MARQKIIWIGKIHFTQYCAEIQVGGHFGLLEFGLLFSSIWHYLERYKKYVKTPKYDALFVQHGISSPNSNS